MDLAQAITGVDPEPAEAAAAHPPQRLREEVMMIFKNHGQVDVPLVETGFATELAGPKHAAMTSEQAPVAIACPVHAEGKAEHKATLSDDEWGPVASAHRSG